MIPKIIHQTWKTEQIPEQWKSFAESWKLHHPDWDYILWTNADGLRFVESFYPKFLPTYLAYPHDIQRADAIRYLVIHHYGGLYVDLDFECLQSFEPLLNTKQLIAGFEPQKHANQQSRPEMLCNALLASQPRSPFLQAVIDFLASNNTKGFAHDILATTGPVMLQSIYELSNKVGVDAHPAIRFYPFVNNAPELLRLAENSATSESIREELVNLGCFAVHHWANSWLTQSSEALLNPDPKSINGYDFYPRQDSPGADLFNGGRDIMLLADRCRNNPKVVAFNTKGFAKHTICATTDFQTMLNAKSNEGIYVKHRNNPWTEQSNQPLSMQFANLTAVGPKPFRLFLDDANDSTVSPYIRHNQVWEPVETALINKLVGSGDTVLDVGAHIGYFTVLLSQLVGPHGKVYSFEPEFANHALLHTNVLTNCLRNVTIENQAISSHTGVAELYLSSYNKGDHRIAFTPGREVQKISRTTLDEYFGNDPAPVHFIKCDTQGHELDVLRGMRGIIQHNLERLCCLLEFSPNLLNATNIDGTSHFIEFFSRYEAEIYWINEESGNHKLVFMDKAALYDLAGIMVDHEDYDYSNNMLVFFSKQARLSYFKKLGW
ncbi:FkbM family methyltransferase [Arenicella xantha]|uniref:FkbM family methyltransferase n=1 Tax=Arenicella xantha TaxID=644221 RepID=A0A395JJG1_9GAMM|nr:FkbM family methyltransferase [Arenicella xantha]RBP50649.1 FkbM family methyltransferase [Arenicella xantha]